MLTAPLRSWGEFADFVQRRATLMLRVIVLGCVVTICISLTRPQYYQSSEIIQIALPKVSEGLVPSTVPAFSARRLQLIQQRLMTRDDLLDIIQAYGLFADRPRLTSEEQVDIIRKSVRIHSIPASSGTDSANGAISVLTISATMHDPEQARQIAHELSHRIIKLSTISRIDQAQETVEFLTAREESLAIEVAVLEDTIAAYRSRNDLHLPGSLALRQAEIATLNSALLVVDREMIKARRKQDKLGEADTVTKPSRIRNALNEQIGFLQDQRKSLNERKSELVRAIETPQGIQRELGMFERQLSQLRSRLDEVSIHRADAEVSVLLESQRRAERLTVIEPAALPDHPLTNIRRIVLMWGILLSLVTAFISAYVAELRDPVIRTSKRMKRDLKIEPLVLIPDLSRKEKQDHWFSRIRSMSDNAGSTGAAAE